MKAALLITLAIFSASSYAIELVPEAICTGTMSGKEITVTSHVNSQKWCSGRKDMKSVVTVEGDGPFAKVYSAVAKEIGAKTKHVNNEPSNKMELLLNMGAYPETGKILLNSVTTELSCTFIQYELEC